MSTITHAIIIRDKDFGSTGRAVIHGDKAYCDQYLADHANHDLLRAYTSQPARFTVTVEPITAEWMRK